MTDTHEEETHEETLSVSYRPAEHFLQLYGGKNQQDKNYLPVAHRVHWFNEDCPRELSITTEIVYHAPDKPVTVEAERWVGPQGSRRREIQQVTKPGEVIVKATVTDHQRKKTATAHKYECAANFEDAVEKAETGAIGRALALLGYGTLSAELDEGRIVDSPTEGGEGKTAARPASNSTPQKQNGAARPASTPATPAKNPARGVLPIPGVPLGTGPVGGAVAIAPTKTETKGGEPPAVPASPPAAPTTPGKPTAAPSLSLEEHQGRVKDYELSVSPDVFAHFIRVECEQSAKRSEWDYALLSGRLEEWVKHGEAAWRTGVVTPDLVEKAQKLAAPYPKTSYNALKSRLPFMKKDDGTLKATPEATTDEVLQIIAMLREVAYANDLGLSLDLFVDPSTKARIPFHHLKTEFGVDHPLDLYARSADSLQDDGTRAAYEQYLEGEYLKNPSRLLEESRRRYASRLPALPSHDQAADAPLAK